MPIFQAIVLGITQGLTEFLPISSSGHLEIVPWLFNWNEFAGDSKAENTFDVSLHFGTLIGAATYLRKDICFYSKAGLSALVGRRPWNAEAKIGWLLLLSSMPAAIVAVIFEPFLLRQSDRLGLIAVGLAVFGVILWLVDRSGRDERSTSELSLAHSFAMGIGQCVALLPGVSRSGIMITTARKLGYGRPHAARLAFLMGLPIIAGAALFRSVEVAADGMPSDMGAALLAGTATSAITGWCAVHAMLRWTESRGYGGFAIYRVSVALLIAMVLMVR